MPIPSSDENKTALRRHCRSMVVADPLARSKSITAHVSQLITAHPEWRCIATFFPLVGEPDLTALSQLLPEHRFAYPRIQGSTMTFHRIDDPTAQLIPTRWNLREPQADLPTVGPEEIDVMLCPGVAFDTAGHRLGKGKGFYDRYLATSQPSRPYLIGVTFASYLFSRIPHETHDKSMDLIITEEGMIAPK